MPKIKFGVFDDRSYKADYEWFYDPELRILVIKDVNHFHTGYNGGKTVLESTKDLDPWYEHGRDLIKFIERASDIIR
jgi:hypothetical protein